MSSEPAVDWPHAGKRHRHHSEAHIPINYPRYRLSCASRHVRISRSPAVISTKFSRNFFVGEPRECTAPTMTFQISIPSFLVVGSWIRVSASFMLNSRRLTRAQAVNGRSLVILWLPCRFRSGKRFQSCGDREWSLISPTQGVKTSRYNLLIT